MLSFFSSKKKSSPETPPEDITIQGPVEGGGEEFVIVDNQTNRGGTMPFHSSTPMMPMYPYPPVSFGMQPSNNNPSNNNQTPVPYVMGIPFKLSPQLCKASFDVTQMEVDGILALMTKQLQLESSYDFKLERGILNECC